MSYLAAPVQEGTDTVRCLKCHFEYEEKHAMHLLPRQLCDQLLREHRMILSSMAAGALPLPLLKRHAELEEKTFPRFLPAAMAVSLSADHKEYERILFGGC